MRLSLVLVAIAVTFLSLTRSDAASLRVPDLVDAKDHVIRVQLPWEKEERQPPKARAQPKSEKGPRKSQEKPQPSTPTEVGLKRTEMTYRGVTIAAAIDENGTLAVRVNDAEVGRVKDVGLIKPPLMHRNLTHLLSIIWTKDRKGDCSSYVVLSIAVADGTTQMQPGVGACGTLVSVATSTFDEWTYSSAIFFHERKPRITVAVIKGGKLTLSEQPARPCLFEPVGGNAECIGNLVAAAHGTDSLGVPTGEAVTGRHEIATFHNSSRKEGTVRLNGEPLRTLQGVDQVHLADAVGSGESSLFGILVRKRGQACTSRMMVLARAGDQPRVLDGLGECKPSSATHIERDPSGQLKRWARVFWKESEVLVQLVMWDGDDMQLKSATFNNCLAFRSIDAACLKRVLDGTQRLAAPPPAARPAQGRPPIFDVIPGLTTPGTATTGPGAASSIQLGRKLIQENKLDQGIAELDRALIVEPNNADAYTWRGYGLALKARYDQAMSDLDRAVQIAPRKADAYFFRGMVYLMRNEPDRALTQYDQATLLAPNLPVHSFRAEAYLAKKEPDKALETIAKDVATRATARGHTIRARAYLQKKEHSRAIAEIDRAIALGPESIFMRALRASAHNGLGKTEQAIADYARAVAMPVKTPSDIVAKLVANEELKRLKSGEKRAGPCKEGSEICL